MTEQETALKVFETRRAPGFLFNALSKAYDAHTNKRLKALELTASQWPVLDQIYLNPGINQRELATLCLRDPSTLVSTIDALEKKGLVRRVADENDRRAFRLVITEAGTEARNTAFDVTHALFEQATHHLSQQEIEHLYNTCLTIYVALQEIDD